MNYEEARRLIIAEGIGQDGILVGVRMGTTPTTERMSPLLQALEVVFHELGGRDAIDRELANALFGLTFHLQGEIDGWIARGVSIRESFIGDEMVRLFLLVESILEDEWMLE